MGQNANLVDFKLLIVWYNAEIQHHTIVSLERIRASYTYNRAAALNIDFIFR